MSYTKVLHDALKGPVDYSKLKPFDYERAKAGAPVVTAGGRPVTQVVKFDIPDKHYCIRAVDELGFIAAYSESDLRMAPEKKSVTFYANIYSADVGYTYANEQDANVASRGSNARLGGKAHKVTIEYEE